MRKLMLLLGMAVLWCMATVAQTRTVKGFIRDGQGNAVPYASVIIKGTSNGVTADDKGAYSIEANTGDVLVISSTGFRGVELTVGRSGEVNATMAPETDLSEVVVTALGISREKKSLPYSAQSVKQEDFNKVRPTDISAALAGKVAGLQVLGTPGSNFGEGNVRLRGISNLAVGNPIYVVDGTIVNLNSINLDEVENITVLKGPSATALYGIRAAGGAIELTLKKSKKGTKPTVQVNSLTEFGNVSLLPDYQNEYGGGYSQDWNTFTFNPNVHPASWSAFNGHKLVEYNADESWGPKLDGTLVREWFSWYPGDDFGQLTPFSANPDNVKDFYQTSTRLNNNIVFAGGGDATFYRLSYSNRYTTLPFPNTSLKENLFAIRGGVSYGKFTASANVNLNVSDQLGDRTEGYTNDGQNIAQNFNQWFQRQLSMDKLRDYKNPAGGYRTWNIRSPTDLRPAYWDNVYYQVYESFRREWSNRIFGDITLSYEILPELKASAIMRGNFLNYGGDERVASFGLELDEYNINNGQFKEMNYEYRLDYNKRFGNFGLRQLVGANFMNQTRRFNSAGTVGGLSVPELYSLSASKDRPNVGNTWLDYRYNSVFASGTVDYKNFIFVDYSIRNDWVSSLPSDINSYLFPSVGASFVFSDLLGSNVKSVMNYGKIRAAYGQSGTGLDAYVTNLAYSLGTPYGSNPTMGVPTTVYDPNIKAALSNEFEFGTELQFFRSRFGVDFTWYRKNGTDQIIPLAVTPSSGASNVYINAGLLRSQGWELVVNAAPVQTRDFRWTIQLNIARNISDVLDLDSARGLTNYQLGRGAFGPTVNARVGEDWATFIGTRNLIDEKSGLPVITNSGNWVRQTNQNLGSALPDYIGGGVTTFTYKDFTLSGTVSWQKGGMFFSTTRLFNLYSGLVTETVGNNDKGVPKRDDVAAGGGVRVDGVLADGTPKTVYVDAQTYYGNQFGLHNFFLQDASFLKLAEARLSYSIAPGKIFRGMRGANIAFIVRNPWLISAPAKDWGIDPSEIENGAAYYEGGQLPPIRSYGLNLSFNF